MTAYLRPHRVGTLEESAAVMAALRRRSGLTTCERDGCHAPARDRFGALQLCSEHVTEAMKAAYAFEVA